MKLSHTHVLVAAVAVLALLLIEVDCKSGSKKRTNQKRESTNDVAADEGTSIFAWLWDDIDLDADSNSVSDKKADKDEAKDDKKPVKPPVLSNAKLEVLRQALSDKKKRTYQEKEHDLVVRGFWDWLYGSSSNTDTTVDDGSDGGENSVVISNTGSNTDTGDISNQPIVESDSDKPKKNNTGKHRGLLNANMNILRRVLN